MNREEKSFWLNYVKSQHERLLAQSKNSGFTNWALFTAVIVALFRLLEDFPAILANDQRELLISWLPYFVCIICDLLFVGGYFLLGVGILTNINLEKRRISESSQGQYALLKLFAVAYCASVLLLNIYVASAATGNRYPTWPFYFFAFFHFTNTYIPIRHAIRRFYYSKIMKYEIPDFVHLTFDRASRKAQMITVLTILFFVLSSIMYLLLVKTNFNISADQISLLLKNSIELLGAVMITLFLVARFARGNQSSLLSDLERRIIQDEIEEGDIREFLDEKIFGPSVRKWLEQRKQEFCDKKDGYHKNIEEIENLLSEIKTIDKKYKLERTGRLEMLVDKLQRANDEFSLFLNGVYLQMRELKRYVELDGNEKESLMAFANEMADRKASEKAKELLAKSKDMVAAFKKEG